jgi:hypothetical protein
MFICQNRQSMIVYSNHSQLAESTEVWNSTVATPSQTRKFKKRMYLEENFENMRLFAKTVLFVSFHVRS